MQARPSTIGKLVLSAANRVLREILIDRRRLSIGRRPYNDLLLDDLTVSGEHAIVHTIDGESIIHDLKSRNGTLVNGVPVMQQPLVDGDCIDVGIYRLMYKVETLTGLSSLGLGSATRSGRDGQPAQGSDDTGRYLPAPLVGARQASWPTSGTSGTPSLPAPPRESPYPPLPAASLRYLSGHDAGKHQVLERPIVSVRNGSGQVAVVARRHNGYFVTHVEGLAYPLVNGESIGLGAHALGRNDLIELAGTIIQFCYDT